MNSTSPVLPLADRPDVHGFVWCSSIFCVLVAVWTGLRIYARTMRQMPMVIEDVLYHVSVAAFYGYIIALYMATYLGGAGYHMNQLDRFHISRFTQSFLMVQALYGLSMCTIKWSMLFMLKRIFAVRYFKIITWVIIALQAGWLVMTILIGFLICRPVAKNWDPTSPGGVCGNRLAGYTAVSVVNVLVDILMLALPLPMVFRLQVKPGYKWALFGIFGIGVVTVVFSVIRLLSLTYVDFTDFSYTVPRVMIWTTAENGVIIIVASSTLLRPVFDRVFGRLSAQSGSRTNDANGSGNRLETVGDRYSVGTGEVGRSVVTRSSLILKDFVCARDRQGNQSKDSQELDTLTPRSHAPVKSCQTVPPCTPTRAEDEKPVVSVKDNKTAVTQTYTEV